MVSNLSDVSVSRETSS